MILYVETNFVLELAFRQEEYGSCRALLTLARERDDVSLAMPAFCVGEAYGRQIRRERDRTRLSRELEGAVGDLSRSLAHADSLDEFRRVTALLARSGREERRNLEAVLDEIRAVGRLIPLDEAVVREARRQERRRGLGPQDALVYASVLEHLENGPPAGGRGCFVTRDDHFTDEDIRLDLEALGCKLLFRFDAALGYIVSRAP